MKLRKRFRIITWVISVLIFLVWVSLATWLIVDAQQQIKNEKTQTLLQAGFSQAEINEHFRQLEPTRKKDILDTITLDRKPDVFDTIELEGDVFDQIAPDTKQSVRLSDIPETPKTIPDEFWYCCAAALASFAGIWLIYWIIRWFIRAFKIPNRQKRIIVLWLGILIFILIGLFPPNDERGYGFMGNYSEFEFLFDTSSHDIAFGKLLIMWFVVTAIIVGFIYTFQDKKPEDEQNNK